MEKTKENMVDGMTVDEYYIEYTNDDGLERYNENDEIEYCDGVFVEVWTCEEDAYNGTDPFDSYTLAVGYELRDKSSDEIKRVVKEYAKDY